MKYEDFLRELRRPEPKENIEVGFESELAKLLASARKGFSSVDDLNEALEEIQEWHNDYPQADFEGLSANEMSRLLYYPFEEYCPVKFKTNIPQAALDKIGFFRLVEEFLRIVERNGSLKLTKAGQLQETFSSNSMNTDLSRSGF